MVFRLNVKSLFNRYALCKVSRLIYIKTLGNTYIVSQQLQWNDCKGCCKMRICLRHIYGEVRSIFDIIISKCSQAHQVSATALALYHIADCFFIKSRLCKDADHQCTVFDQGDSSVFQLTCCICLRMDVTDLFHLQAAFQTDCIINATTDEEYIFCIRLFRCEPLDAFFVIDDSLDLIRQSFKFFNICRVLFLGNRTFYFCKLNSQHISCNQLCAVRFLLLQQRFPDQQVYRRHCLLHVQ